MGFFNKVFGKKNTLTSHEEKQKAVELIINLAKKNIENLETLHGAASQEGKFEIFMLNLEFFVQFLRDYDYVKDEQDFRFLLIYNLKRLDYNPLKSLSDSDFLDYYTSRTAIIEYEISSLNKAMGTNTNFIPVYSYTSIYKTPLINKPDVSSLDVSNPDNMDIDEMEIAFKFMLDYANHIRYIAQQVNEFYPSK